LSNDIIDLDCLSRVRAGRTLVMGVVNATPDSFSDGGDFLEPAFALAHARRLIAEGADIVDIGGESTRPGASEVDAATELARVLPVVTGLGRQAIVSIDTYKAAVADAALAAGARIVNDVWGLQREPEIARVAGHHGAAVVASHWERDAPRGDLLDGMRRYFDRSIALARAAGIPDHRIILDPGIGFGKDLAANLLILHRLDEIVRIGFPVLVGTSRKRFIGHLTGREPKERLNGTLAANVLAAAAGASIIRVHDVGPHREALAVADAILAGRPVGQPDSPVVAYLALGSNLGDRAAHIRAALAALGARPGTRVIGVSRLYETPPWGPVPQGAYLNACAAIETTLAPRALLDLCLSIERASGRERLVRWGPRTLDVDILLYGGAKIAEPDLTIPHARMLERAFVLVPLMDIAPDLVVDGTPIAAALAGLDRSGIIEWKDDS